MVKQEIKEEDGIHKEWYKKAKEQSLESLPAFLKHLTEDYKHDYGTICHAVASAALAAANAVDHSPGGGITGFQAGAIMWEFVQHWLGYEDEPLRLVKYEEMLYPQYEHSFAKTISKDTWEWLRERAKSLLSEQHGISSVRIHWESIAGGKVPFGYRVREAD